MVAAAVQQTHPDEALAIWKAMASGQIALAKVTAYQTAGGYLQQMRSIYQRTGRMADWEGLLAELRVQNARRPRMRAVLDGLAGHGARIVKS